MHAGVPKGWHHLETKEWYLSESDRTTITLLITFEFMTIINIT